MPDDVGTEAGRPAPVSTRSLSYFSSLGAVRELVVFLTKFGFDHVDARQAGLDSRPEHIRCMPEGSRERLRVEAVGLYHHHHVDPGVPSRASPARCAT